MYYVVYCRDKKNALDLRLANRDEHLAYVGSTIDKIKSAGPMIAGDGETMIGSILIMEGASLQEIEAWSDKDPYKIAGLFESVEITQLNWTLGAPE
jgi:uncharacterized protein YciI